MCLDNAIGDQRDPMSRDKTCSTKSPRLLSGSRTRWILLLSAAVLVVARMALVRGFVAPIYVAGASMAGTLQGQHVRMECEDCQIYYVSGLRFRGDHGETTCPNCGYGQNASSNRVYRGDRVLVDQWYGRWQQPSRWDLVALQSPDGSGEMIVKRIIGMPGEQVAIRSGDLFVDGRLLRKPLSVFREMMVLVHDDRFIPTTSAKLPRRWRGEQASTSWKPVTHGYRFKEHAKVAVDGNTAQSSHDWLTYRHWLCFSKGVPRTQRTEETSVLDSLGYNQDCPRGQLNAVSDLVLSGSFVIDGEGSFSLRVADGAMWYIAELNWPERKWRLRRDNDVLITVASQGVSCSVPFLMEYGMYDRKVLLTVNGRVLLEFDVNPVPQAPDDAPASRLSIGAVGLSVEASSLRVVRDVYFLAPGPPWTHWDAPRHLHAGHFLLLGDNAAMSTDSRHWTSAGIARNSITGRVIRWSESRPFAGK